MDRKKISIDRFYIKLIFEKKIKIIKVLFKVLF